mmetsp:Transcript_6474/g.10068  ORF Transcript_6474/g.10068 Transcript_6474/m.10068 type:complete len:297 (+) Transcript_6474:522-1412(+)
MQTVNVGNDGRGQAELLEVGKDFDMRLQLLRVCRVALGCASIGVAPGHQRAGLGVAIVEGEELGGEVGEGDLVVGAQFLDGSNLFLVLRCERDSESASGAVLIHLVGELEEQCVAVVVNTDAHQTQLRIVATGLAVLDRRGWACSDGPSLHLEPRPDLLVASNGNGLAVCKEDLSALLADDDVRLGCFERLVRRELPVWGHLDVVLFHFCDDLLYHGGFLSVLLRYGAGEDAWCVDAKLGGECLVGGGGTGRDLVAGRPILCFLVVNGPTMSFFVLASLVQPCVWLSTEECQLFLG